MKADGDTREMVTRVVYDAADAVNAGAVARADHLLRQLDGFELDGVLVREVLDGAVAQHRARLLGNGWSEHDLVEVVRRRLKVPGPATYVDRGVRELALLWRLRPLPEVSDDRSASSADAGMLAKIRALLAKAESTTFPAEAEAFSAKAQALMARHRIDQVSLGDAPDRDRPVGRRIWLDDPYAAAKARLLFVVARANRCQAVRLSDLGCCHVIGFPVDLQVVELLHTSLLVQATTALAAAGPQTDARGRSRTRSFRQSFLHAYAWRIGQRLAETSAATEAELDAERGGALLPVLARREEAVEAAIASVFPSLRRARVSISNGDGWAAGRVAADRADLAVGARLAEQRP